MVQEEYGVRLATHEKGRLRQMIRAGRSSACRRIHQGPVAATSAESYLQGGCPLPVLFT